MRRFVLDKESTNLISGYSDAYRYTFLITCLESFSKQVFFFNVRSM
ncbi:hypothetical protein HMPREF1989_01956 [Porphyromonas gingivalis F0566]|nr:hypothetical protein HMPREF1989_01956 [Porphyromonas gingivalis F0566]